MHSFASNIRLLTVLSTLFLLPSAASQAGDELHGTDRVANPELTQTNWPGFRGPGGRGVALGYAAPESWDATDPDDPSVLWQVEVPGLGHSSPTIFGDKVFLATAVSSESDVPLQVGRAGNIDAADDNASQSWLVLCFDKNSGEELWRREAHKGKPKATRHTKATHANTTIAANDERIVAFFGSEGCYCFSHDGEPLWQRDLGTIDISKYGIGWGYASSPAIYEDKVVLVCDDPKRPFLTTLDLDTGDTLWEVSRQGDSERSWGTALIHASETSAQIVVNGWPWIVSYDLSTGDEKWRIAGGGDNPTPTPFAIEDRIYITNAHGGKSPIYVIRSTASGNLSPEIEESNDASAENTDSRGKAGATAKGVEGDSASIIWTVDRGGSYMSTPVVWGDYLYLGNTNGVIRCFHALTGEKTYEKRLPGAAAITASLVAADNKIYCPSEQGSVFVLKAGPKFEVLAENPMGAPCFASPALSAGVLFIRTTKSLVAIKAD